MVVTLESELAEFRQAIEVGDWVTVARIVDYYAVFPTDDIGDWLGGGDWHGDETPQKVAAEWDEISAEEELRTAENAILMYDADPDDPDDADELALRTEAESILTAAREVRDRAYDKARALGVP